MSQSIIAASGAPYDGHSREVMLESIARCGFTHVEPAFIVGYTEPFDETAFGNGNARLWRARIANAGLSCSAMSSHIDLGAEDAVSVFSGRMRFAADIGARVIATNAALQSREIGFHRNIEPLLRLAEQLDVVIALENPGDGSQNVFDLAEDGIAIVDSYRSPWLRLNYDAANTSSHRPQLLDVAEDAIRALPASAQAHIKDLRRTSEGWFFTAIGDGEIDCRRILAAIAAHPAVALTIELPLRLHRDARAQPIRKSQPVPLRDIEDALIRSLAFVRGALGTHAGMADQSVHPRVEPTSEVSM